MSLAKILAIASFLLAAGAHAQTLVVVPANGEVTRANDEATLTLAVEEQDQDKNAAAARVNAKMKQGTDIVRRADPTAKLQTQGYYTYAVYPDNDPARPLAASVKRVPIGWRVGQYLDVKTTNLAGLQKTAGAAQGVMHIYRVRFGVSAALTKQLDDERIAAAYRNLTERVASIARAMGKQPADATINSVDFEGSGNFTDMRYASPQRVEVTGSRIGAPDMAEPSFEPGETTLQMRVVGKITFR
ncbi:MAG: SIMPL domain-containing protein [Pseudomonadota bacterium]|nr:SIMPL domain-containing protein [Pseudomonadota bacterium]